MTVPVLTNDGRAVIFDRVTGEKLTVSVPTALENVANGRGRFVHGDAGERMKGEAAAPAPAPEPAIPLTEPDVLPLPEADRPVPAENPLAGADDATRDAIEGRARPVSDEHVHEDAAPKPHPLDHDGDGRKGGSKPRAKKPDDPERAAVIAELKAKGVKFFAGASTDKLKSLLPG